MSTQPRDPAGRWIAIEPGAPDSRFELAGACVLIVFFTLAALIL